MSNRINSECLKTFEGINKWMRQHVFFLFSLSFYWYLFQICIIYFILWILKLKTNLHRILFEILFLLRIKEFFEIEKKTILMIWRIIDMLQDVIKNIFYWNCACLYSEIFAFLRKCYKPIHIHIILLKFMEEILVSFETF